MTRTTTLFISLMLLGTYCKAQVYIEPFIGYQIDLTSNDFKQVNTGLQCSFKKSKGYEFVLHLQESWAIPFIASDSSFTTNPALPVYASAKKTIQPKATSFSVGHRFVVAGKKTANIFSILFNTGITYQNIKVSYQYDKSNYTILNSDKTQSRLGFYISGGAEYMRLLTSGRIFFQLNVATPPFGKKVKYPSSFYFMAPLAINIGYAVAFKNK